MTKDLALLVHGDNLTDKDYLTTQQFLAKLKENLDKALV
jgi:isocitrate dehydrogenase